MITEGSFVKLLLIGRSPPERPVRRVRSIHRGCWGSTLPACFGGFTSLTVIFRKLPSCLSFFEVNPIVY